MLTSFAVRDGFHYQFWVYILTSRTGTLYVGITNDRSPETPSPRALMLGGSTTIIPALRRDAAPFFTDATGPAVEPLIVVAPEDGATATRMPPETRPMVSWITRGAAFCLIEWQFGQSTGEKWEGSGFAFVRNGPETSRDGAPVTMRAPFGVGRQPHRWRIWAISDRGDVARSPWRTLFYTN